MDRSTPPHGRLAAVVGVGCVVVVVVVLAPFHDHVTRATPDLLLVVPVLVAAVLGGRWPAAVTAIAATIGFSLGFIPPVGSLRVDVPEDTVALAVFLAVALVAGSVVAREAERRREALDRATEVNRVYLDYRRVVAEREVLAAEAARVETLEAVDRQRSLLLRSVSHDLRTPLASIRAVSTELRDGYEYDLAVRNELLDLVTQETDRLDRIVANMLSLSRIEAGALVPDLAAVDLEGLVRSTVARLGRLLATHPLTVDVAADVPAVAADRVQVDQVLTNLLENAVKHTPAGTPIRVRAWREDDRVTVVVSDGGPGVDEALAAHLFEPFRSRTTTGIGLTICRAIVEGHGGSLSLRGAAEGGVEVRFALRPC